MKRNSEAFDINNVSDDYDSINASSRKSLRYRSDSYSPADDSFEHNFINNDDASPSYTLNNSIKLENPNSSSIIAKDRLEKSRERNREHAKRTRLRKKVQFETMKLKLLELQNEAAKLEELLAESNTANILLCMNAKTKPGEISDLDNQYNASSSSSSSSSTTSSSFGSPNGGDAFTKKMSSGKDLINELRVSVRAEAATKRVERSVADTEEYLLNSSFNDDFDDNAHHLSFMNTGSSNSNNPEIMRKERNRMHAKMTRDRKKMLLTKMQDMIANLESNNELLNNRLTRFQFLNKPLANNNYYVDQDRQHEDSTSNSTNSSTNNSTANNSSSSSSGDNEGDGNLNNHNGGGSSEDISSDDGSSINRTS